ncbi:hypothetical protein [Butyrivibrio sp.]|uniref:hypothetical protein n=1 Tax=Butyrivibrio sp. TaxID=28121 RepID=UPI0025BA7C1F|nr:hypothetical protein [Butyrivibrio sp.]MBQ9304525.1 hypothetical protein [Butyrivibrio sp.]
MGRVSRGFSSSTSTKNDWNAKTYTRVFISIKRDKPNGKCSEKERLIELAKAQGKSTSRYIIDAINAYAGENVLTILDNDSKKKKAK